MPRTYSLRIIAILAIAAVAQQFDQSSCLARADEPKHGGAAPVPFTLAKPDKPLILLQTMVNDKGPFRFVLDTGAGGTIITPALAKKLNILPDKQDKESKATGAGGDVQVRSASVKSLAIGKARLERLDVAIMDLTGISKAIGTDLDGIVGYNFLKQYRVTIDYRGHTVTFE
jgi:predicted aspartyl protease